MFRLLFAIAMAIGCCSLLHSQQAVSREIKSLESSGTEFRKTNIFSFASIDIHNRYQLEGLKKGTIVNIDLNSIHQLLISKEEFIQIPVPVSSRSLIVLTLHRHEIFAPDFHLYTSSDPGHAVDYTPGLHYRGIVEGDPNSLVAISIFENQIMGMVATDEGNYVLGPMMDDKENRHVFYNDRDLETIIPFECGTVDNEVGYTEQQLKSYPQNRDINDCVRIHIEINDDVVSAKGGVVPATDYMTAILNQCFVIYANEQISMVLSEIMAWTTNSPYTGGNSGQMLGSYQANTEYFNGDLSQLISFDSLYGGVAPGLSGLCASSPDYSKCFSGVRHNYSNVPLFSWPVFVITHEFGHLLGSNHTHACVWNGNNTKIDGCGGTGGCDGGIIPPEGGTIMSYCYPSNGSFINFNLGFGSQPGNVIKNSVNASSNCLSPCGQPVAYCESNGASGTQEYIKKVVLANLNNQSGNNNGYANFTSLPANLNAGNTYMITLTPNFTGGNNTKYWRLYIDFNLDFDWYDAGECVSQGTGNNTINLTFTIPPGTPSLSTRMRVSMKLAGFPAFCGLLPSGEVEDYTVVINPAAPTCSDGILNQGEEQVDCGGPCAACPLCTDGIQNGGETGIDCGGPCTACTLPDSTLLLGSYFETGMDSWIDGGADVTRVNSPNSYEGLYSIQLADNSGNASAMTSPNFNLSQAIGVQISFHFFAVSMESGEDFWIQYKNGSGNWTTIANLVSGAGFVNNAHYSATVTVPNFVPTSSGTFRIQCDASDNNDQVFIDAVRIIRLNGTELIEEHVQIKKISERPSNSGQIILYPNPATDLLYIQTDHKIDHLRIINVNGQDVGKKVRGETTTGFDISSLDAGLYIVYIRSGNQITTARFVKI